MPLYSFLKKLNQGIKQNLKITIRYFEIPFLLVCGLESEQASPEINSDFFRNKLTETAWWHTSETSEWNQLYFYENGEAIKRNV